MVDKFLELGFQNMGQFSLNNNELAFGPIYLDHDRSNVIWVVATLKETLYVVGETIDSINITLKDMVKGNRNRATRDKIHSLIEDYSINHNVYFLVGEAGVHSKRNLIEQFCPIGNIKGVNK